MPHINSLHSTSEDKHAHMRRLSDEHGRFSMLAVDQRQSLRGMIAEEKGIQPTDIPGSDLTRIKRIVAETVAPTSSAVLLDPIYGFPKALENADGYGGVLVAAEVTGYETVRERERLSRLVDEWDPAAWVRKGVDGVKLLLWHHPAVSTVARQHQESLVERVGAQCAEAGLPLLLEAKVYPLYGTSLNAGWARVKPYLVIDAAKTYSAPRFAVDLLKLDFPVDLKYVEEYQRPDVEWKAGEAVYDLGAVQSFCERLDEAAQVPWVILSAGVDLEEFVENIRLANEAGASGFLCGRTVWKNVISEFPDEKRMRDHMIQVGVPNFHAILEANESALPWHQHRCFQSDDSKAVGHE